MKAGDMVNKRITVSMLLIIALLLSACGTAQPPSNDEQTSINETSPTPEITEEQPYQNTSTAVSSPEEVKTDWNTFECTYFGDIPVGLLTVPDATVSEVEKYINLRLDADYSLSTHELYNAYQAYQVEVDDVFGFHGYKGQAVFEFDWAGTLSNIIFQFYDDGITPEIMRQIHDDIAAWVGSPCSRQVIENKGSSLKHEYPAIDDSVYCTWQSSITDGLPFDASLSSYFTNGHSMQNEIAFERTVSEIETNYSAVDERDSATTDTLTYNGLTIKAKYHAGSNPYVDGTATNNSASYVEFVRIKVHLYNSDGKVIDTEWTYAVGAEGLAPGETTQWIVYCSDADEMRISIMD